MQQSHTRYSGSSILTGQLTARIGLVMCCLVSVLFLAPEEKTNASEKKDKAFWHSKATKDWTAEEIQLFFRESPWAKTEKIVISIKNSADPGTAPTVAGAKVMRFESCCRSFEVPASEANADAAASSQTQGSQDYSQGLGQTFAFAARISWFSSVTFRKAMLRRRELQGAPVESASALAPSNEYVLALSGSFLKLLEGLPQDGVRTSASLRSSRGTRVVPSEYIAAQPDADPMAFLIFPKAVDGKPTFTRQDGTLTFGMKGMDFSLECEFPLQPMMVDGTLDW
jgi:hypothetical protein